MTTPLPSSPANELEQMTLVLKQFHKDIHELRLGRGEANQVFGRDEFAIFESASQQANVLLRLCSLETANHLNPFMEESTSSFLFKLRRAANNFINVIKFKYRSLSENEEAMLECLEPFIEECLDSVHSASQLTQSNKPPQSKASKRSTIRNEGQSKLIAALTMHHEYSDNGCQNRAPVGNNELARLAKVAPSTASAFFKVHFQGHQRYMVMCHRNIGKLVTTIKILRNEFRPKDLEDIVAKERQSQVQKLDHAVAWG